MKKKFIIFTLCFTLIFSSLNYKKSYADAGVISLPMLATVCTLGVATGMAFNNVDELYNIGKIFYEKNKTTWDTVVLAFNSAVSFNKVTNKLSVGKSFVDIFKSTFSDYSSTKGDSYVYSSELVSCFEGIELYKFTSNNPLVYSFGNSFSVSVYMANNYGYLKVSDFNANNSYSATFGRNPSTVLSVNGTSIIGNGTVIDLLKVVSSWGYTISNFGAVSLPYTGVYDPSVLDDDDEIYLPSDLGGLVAGGVKPGDILGDTPFDGASNGDISLPHSSNPSISVDSSISFPFVGDSSVDSPSNPSLPSEGIWSTIKDFIISLVVPSDAFWTDTWGGLYNNFVGSFPMVDMSGFDDLVTGEKKFPNIDIDIMGITGRVVNGDVINSIVDWLRPIIAGFMMICLMLFNYRKIYKLIRNTEPFGGVAPGTSDFKTGISEYQNYEDYKQSLREYRDFLYNQRGK